MRWLLQYVRDAQSPSAHCFIGERLHVRVACVYPSRGQAREGITHFVGDLREQIFRLGASLASVILDFY